MPRARVNDVVELEYDAFGDPADPALVLITGWGAQMIFWPEEFCAQLAAEGFHVVRFDNRDTGLSTHLSELGLPDVGAVRAGQEPPPYTLDDMAADTVALFDALGVSAAHVVGISMGGEIGQVLTIRHPDRVLTLVSMMSSVGGPDTIHAPSQQVDRAGPAPVTLDDIVERTLGYIRGMSSPKYFDPDRTRAAVRRAIERSHDPDGRERQAAAVHFGPSRSEALRGVRTPVLVIHGELDEPLENAYRVVNAVPGARLEIIPDLAHDIPSPLWGRIIGLIVEHAREREAPAAARG